MTAIECDDDNESITLKVLTTKSACGLDPSTDGSAEDTEPVRLECTVYVHTERGSAVRYRVLCQTMTLRQALAGAQPTWQVCQEFDCRADEIRAALDRLVPSWRSGQYEAEFQLASESILTGDEWESEIGQRHAEVRWFALARGESK